MTETKRWVVTTEGSRSLTEIKGEITSCGFNVEDVLSEIGCITGSATDDVAKQVRNITGVADVSPEGPSINIGPPDAPITW